MGFMQIRNMPDATREAITQAAKARGWSVAKYVCKLYELHQGMVDSDLESRIKEMLEAFDLQRVTR